MLRGHRWQLLLQNQHKGQDQRRQHHEKLCHLAEYRVAHISLAILGEIYHTLTDYVHHLWKT